VGGGAGRWVMCLPPRNGARPPRRSVPGAKKRSPKVVRDGAPAGRHTETIGGGKNIFRRRNPEQIFRIEKGGRFQPGRVGAAQGGSFLPFLDRKFQGFLKKQFSPLPHQGEFTVPAGPGPNTRGHRDPPRFQTRGSRDPADRPPRPHIFRGGQGHRGKGGLGPFFFFSPNVQRLEKKGEFCGGGEKQSGRGKQEMWGAARKQGVGGFRQPPAEGRFGTPKAPGNLGGATGGQAGGPGAFVGGTAGGARRPPGHGQTCLAGWGGPARAPHRGPGARGGFRGRMGAAREILQGGRSFGGGKRAWFGGAGPTGGTTPGATSEGEDSLRPGGGPRRRWVHHGRTRLSAGRLERFREKNGQTCWCTGPLGPPGDMSRVFFLIRFFAGQPPGREGGSTRRIRVRGGREWWPTPSDKRVGRDRGQN